jgi:hypothetical protein
MDASLCPACGKPLDYVDAFDPAVKADLESRGAPLAFARVCICRNPDCDGPFREVTSYAKVKGNTYIRKIAR